MGSGRDAMVAPTPRFTIEDLLRKAVEAVSFDEQGAFTMREMADLWGCSSLKTARVQQDILKKRGWRFEPTRKPVVNRAGIINQAIAYIVIPPERREGDGDE
jgi:hypothetical protein